MLLPGPNTFTTESYWELKIALFHILYLLLIVVVPEVRPELGVPVRVDRVDEVDVGRSAEDVVVVVDPHGARQRSGAGAVLGRVAVADEEWRVFGGVSHSLQSICSHSLLQDKENQKQRRWFRIKQRLLKYRCVRASKHHTGTKTSFCTPQLIHMWNRQKKSRTGVTKYS